MAKAIQKLALWPDLGQDLTSRPVNKQYECGQDKGGKTWATRVVWKVKWNGRTKEVGRNIHYGQSCKCKGESWITLTDKN